MGLMLYMLEMFVLIGGFYLLMIKTCRHEWLMIKEVELSKPNFPDIMVGMRIHKKCKKCFKYKVKTTIY